MKAKFLISIAVAGSLLTSCNMYLEPQGDVILEEAYQNVGDAEAGRNYMYVEMRSVTTSGFFTYPEIQMDMFNGLTINGNRGGNFANGNLTSAEGDVASYWGSLYNYINNANNLLTNMPKLIESYEAKEKTFYANRVKSFVAEAHFVRGYMYAEMMDRWCEPYKAATGAVEGKGLPIVLEFYPTAERDKYKGRSTMNALIEAILDDFEAAMSGLDEWSEYLKATINDPEADSSTKADCSNFQKAMTGTDCYYFNQNTIKAMMARLGLWIGEYTFTKDYKALGITAGQNGLQVALKCANDVIGCGVYTLCNTKTYAKLWTNDSGSEVIWRSFMLNTELSGSIGGMWNSTLITTSDYIPTPGCIELYASEGKDLKGYKDCRYASFLGKRDLSANGEKISTQIFNKYPGNPDLEVSGINLMNMSKHFRLSELVLIKAEAAFLTNDFATANDALNELRENRITGWTAQTYAGAELYDQIKKERCKELIGEGFRMSDLRRWGAGFSRAGESSYSNSAVDGMLVPAGLRVTYVPNDYRYTWPIPSDEFKTNPQMAGQQNPGY